MNPKQALETDLIAGFAAAMTLDEIRKRNLGAWAYYTASADSPFRRDCAADFGGGWARFQSMLPALEELLSAWHEAAIDVTVFKGFAMAQCVYPHPALRYFGDVDLYVPPTNSSGLGGHACGLEICAHVQRTARSRQLTAREQIDHG